MRRTKVIKLTSTETVPHWGWELGGARQTGRPEELSEIPPKWGIAKGGRHPILNPARDPDA